MAGTMSARCWIGAMAQAGPLGKLGRARAELVGARLATDSGQDRDAAPLLLGPRSRRVPPICCCPGWLRRPPKAAPQARHCSGRRLPHFAAGKSPPRRHCAGCPHEGGLATWSMAELIEAAARTGRPGRAAAALHRLAEITNASGTDWALGIQARCRALLTSGEAAEPLYREAIERLGRARVRTELARAHLVYGEWLRRNRRRVDAREQLRGAHEMLTAMGIEGFAERARRELIATGQTLRKRTVDTVDELTAQEAQVARLAREGHTNPEIGAQLFISARTVEWHLRKVFTKLGISSRRELHAALPELARASVPA
jgi:DNA-binding CsgD family transcriptional regulator